MTMKDGVATFTGLADDTAGTIAFDFSGVGLSTGPSDGVVISPSAAALLVIHVEPSPTAVAGQAFAIQPVVYEEDRFGNIEAGDDGTLVTATLASGAGPLRGAITSMVTGGVATFAGLADDTAATIALRFDGGGLPGATTDPIAIAAESATHLVVTTPPPSIVAAGAPFGIVVEAEDAFGNLVISFDGPVSLVTTGGTLGGTDHVGGRRRRGHLQRTDPGPGDRPRLARGCRRRSDRRHDEPRERGRAASDRVRRLQPDGR